MIGLKLAAKMGGLLEAHLRGDDLDRLAGKQLWRRGLEALFVQPVLRRPAKLPLKITLQLPGRHAAVLRQRGRRPFGHLRPFRPVLDLLQFMAHVQFNLGFIGFFYAADLIAIAIQYV